MKRLLLSAILFSVFLTAAFPQEVKTEGKQVKSDTIGNISVQSKYSEKIDVENITFNRTKEMTGKGDFLQIEFTLRNKIDEEQDVYIFVIATYEKTKISDSSFEMPVPEKELIRSFVPFPDDIKNFQYEDPKNKNKIKLLKYPKNPKAGIYPQTGKPYRLKDKLFITTNHLSRYRNNYFYFNNVTILIFDSEGNPIYRQLYEIKGKRQ